MIIAAIMMMVSMYAGSKLKCCGPYRVKIFWIWFGVGCIETFVYLMLIADYSNWSLG